MTTPLTITSMNQGKISPRHDSDEQYWANFREVQKPEPDGLPRWYAVKLIWTLWPSRRRSVKG